MGLYHSDDVGTMNAHQKKLAGRAVTKWWDVSDEAGPRTRPHAAFSESMPTLEIYTVTDGKLKILC